MCVCVCVCAYSPGWLREVQWLAENTLLVSDAAGTCAEGLVLQPHPPRAWLCLHCGTSGLATCSSLGQRLSRTLCDWMSKGSACLAFTEAWEVMIGSGGEKIYGGKVINITTKVNLLELF